MFPCQENPAGPCCPSPLHLSEIGRMLEMVTSGSFSSNRSIPQVASVSQREPKLSPKEKGLSLYLVRQHRSLENLDEEHGGQVCTPNNSLTLGVPRRKYQHHQTSRAASGRTLRSQGFPARSPASQTAPSETRSCGNKQSRPRAAVSSGVAAPETMPRCWQSLGFSLTRPHPEPSPWACAQGWARPCRECREPRGARAPRNCQHISFVFSKQGFPGKGLFVCLLF